MNTFGSIYRITTFGESHGAGIGGVIDGIPAGLDVDMDFIPPVATKQTKWRFSQASLRERPQDAL